MGGMKKGAGKKPGQILVEAMLEWQAKEAQWLRDEVCLQHSLATARGYLDRINQEKDAIADAIEASVGTRHSRSQHSDAYRATVRTASRGVVADMEDVSKRKVLQRQLITELQRERSALTGAASARKIELDAIATAPLAESLARLEERLAELHARLSGIRVAEARTAAKAMELSLVATSLDAEALLSAPSTVVVLGRPSLGAAGSLLRRTIDTHACAASSKVRGGLVHVLGDPQTTLDVLGGSPTASTNGAKRQQATKRTPSSHAPPGLSTAIERAKHRVRVTTRGAGETSSRHVARILRCMTANAETVDPNDDKPPQASRLLLLSGRLVPGSNGILQIRAKEDDGADADEAPMTLSLHDVLDLIKGTDIAVVVDAFAPGGRGRHGFSLLAIPGVGYAQCWRHRQELPSAHVVANESADGPLAMLVALVAAAGLAVGAGEPDSSHSPAHATVVGLAAHPKTVNKAVALLGSRATVSRDLEPLLNRRDWPSWVPSTIEAAPPAADAESSSDAFAAVPMCDRALLAAVGAPSGATVAFPVRQALRTWSAETVLSCHVSVRANSAFTGDEVAAKVLRLAEAELDAAPLRWILGHVDSRRLTGDNFAAVDASVAGSMLVHVTAVPANATRAQLAQALQAELCGEGAVSVLGSFVTHGAAADAATLRVKSNPGGGFAAVSGRAVETAARAIFTSDAHRTSSKVSAPADDDAAVADASASPLVISTQLEWRVRIRCTIGVYLGLLLLAAQSAVPCREPFVVSGVCSTSMATPSVVPADREADKLSDLSKGQAGQRQPHHVRVVLRHVHNSPALGTRVENAFRALAARGAVSTSTAATAVVWAVPPPESRRPEPVAAGARGRRAASVPADGLNAPRDGAAPEERPLLEVYVGGVLRHRVHWTVSEADTHVGFTEGSIEKAIEAALCATPLVI